MIFQFEYLNKDKIASQKYFQELFFNFISKVDSSLPVGIEIRNPNYLNKDYFEFLEQLKIIPVMLEGYYMPSVIETYGKFLKDFNESIVFRLHGPDRSAIEKMSNEKWNQIYTDRTQELEKLSKLFKDLLKRKIDLFVNVNNHYEGSAPLTIQKLKKIIKV